MAMTMSVPLHRFHASVKAQVRTFAKEQTGRLLPAQILQLDRFERIGRLLLGDFGLILELVLLKIVYG